MWHGRSSWTRPLRFLTNWRSWAIMRFTVEADVPTRAAMSCWVAGFYLLTRDLTFRITSRVRRRVGWYGYELLSVRLLQNFEIFLCSSKLYRYRSWKPQTLFLYISLLWLYRCIFPRKDPLYTHFRNLSIFGGMVDWNKITIMDSNT